MNNVLNIDTRELNEFANRLANLSKTALPNVVRKTLNDAAMDVKKDTMLKAAGNSFEKRQPNFFKYFSKVEFAAGRDINKMQSRVGFTEVGLNGENNYAVKDLEQQEKGGTIGGKSFIPLSFGRANVSGLIKEEFRLQNIKNKWFEPRHVSGKNEKERFVKTLKHAGVGGFILTDRYVFRVNAIEKRKKFDKRGYNRLVKKLGSASGIKKSGFESDIWKLTPLYSVDWGRTIKVAKTSFMEAASKVTVSRIEKMFVKNAEERFKRVLKK